MALATPISVKVKDSIGWTPLHLACTSIESSAFSFRQVFARELESRILNRSSLAAFPFRFAENEAVAIAMCQVLLAAGADVNAKEGKGWLPMQIADSSGWVDLGRLILQHDGSAFSP
jgi:ankyrin repeat protein